VAFILNFFFFWFLVSNACLVSHVRSGGNYLGATKMPNQVKVLPRTKTWQRQLQYNNRNQPQTILTSKQFYTCQLVVHSCCYCRFYTKLEICLWTQGKKYETHIHREEKHEHRKKKSRAYQTNVFLVHIFFLRFFLFFCFWYLHQAREIFLWTAFANLLYGMFDEAITHLLCWLKGSPEMVLGIICSQGMCLIPHWEVMIN